MTNMIRHCMYVPMKISFSVEHRSVAAAAVRKHRWVNSNYAAHVQHCAATEKAHLCLLVSSNTFALSAESDLQLSCTRSVISPFPLEFYKCELLYLDI